ncbi:hypothetical protein [Modestobacter italicus]|uniref:hypothetical protein n=1 Tax=Modestobacter italicus (strain DSM 44449 / CECT 9708 / BC 501) TaxID=2732864 RepID=UPI001FE4B66C|nr:hypothetical protein [Modestobacter italicus]
MPELDELADELYAVPPEEFVAARTAARDRARAAGDKELAKAVAALPKPTTAAWVCNLLSRRRPDEVGQLILLGELLRQAQVDLSADQLRALGRQRNQVVAALARQARAVAHGEGHDVSSAVAEQVEGTLRAAMADPDAGQALLAGRLTTALTYSGLGPVDLSGAVATPVRAGRTAPAGSGVAEPATTVRPPSPAHAADGQQDAEECRREAEERRRQEEDRRREEERRRRELEQARRDAEEAAGVARDAAAAAEDAEQQLVAATDRRDELQEQAARLAEELRRLERRAGEAVTAVGHAEHRRDAAVRRAETAAAIRDRAAARVEQLAAGAD